MIKELLNLNATDHAEGLFGITTERINEITNLFIDNEKIIAANYKQYSCTEKDETGVEHERLHVGKVIEYFFKAIAKTPQEELLIIFCLNPLLHSITVIIDNIRFEQTITEMHPNAKIIKL